MNSNRLSWLVTSDIRGAARTAQEMGFGGVTLDEKRLPELSDTGRREFKKVFADQNLRIVALRTTLDAKGLGKGADLDRVISQLGRVFESASRLGAAVVCVDASVLPKQDDEQAAAAMIELASRADRFSTGVAFSSSLASFASLAALLKSASCPWFGVDLDPLALLRDEQSIDEIFSLAGPSILHVPARDALKGEGNRMRETTVGEGSTDWRELLALLDGAGFHGSFTVESLESAAALLKTSL